VLAQEGDSFIVGFSEPLDAAVFALQVSGSCIWGWYYHNIEGQERRDRITFRGLIGSKCLHEGKAYRVFVGVSKGAAASSIKGSLPCICRLTLCRCAATVFSACTL
jgi:hypothetical protein